MWPLTQSWVEIKDSETWKISVVVNLKGQSFNKDMNESERLLHVYHNIYIHIYYR